MHCRGRLTHGDITRSTILPSMPWYCSSGATLAVSLSRTCLSTTEVVCMANLAADSAQLRTCHCVCKVRPYCAVPSAPSTSLRVFMVGAYRAMALYSHIASLAFSQKHISGLQAG